LSERIERLGSKGIEFSRRDSNAQKPLRVTSSQPAEAVLGLICDCFRLKKWRGSHVRATNRTDSKSNQIRAGYCLVAAGPDKVATSATSKICRDFPNIYITFHGSQFATHGDIQMNLQGDCHRKLRHVSKAAPAGLRSSRNSRHVPFSKVQTRNDRSIG
jgi:hypothetical protein